MDISFLWYCYCCGEKKCLKGLTFNAERYMVFMVFKFLKMFFKRRGVPMTCS